MKTLADIRKEYPDYADMSDGDLAKALHGKFYSDMDFDDFSSKVGLKDTSWGEALIGDDKSAGILRTGLDQGLAGMTGNFADEITDRIGAGIGSLATGESYGDMLNQARDLSKDRMERQLEQRPGLAIGANIAGGVLGLGGLGATKAGTAISNSLRAGNAGARIAKGALAGAASGAAYGAGAADEGQRLEGAQEGLALGAAGGALIPSIGAGANAVAKGVNKAIIPQVDDAIRPLAQSAREQGIPLRLDQVAPTRVRKTLQKVSQELPFSGADSFEDAQRVAFNRAVAKTIGQDADNLGPETIQKFLGDAETKFGSALKGRNIIFSKSQLGKLDTIVKDAEATLTDDVAQVVRKNAQALANDLNSTGFKSATVRGEKLASARSQLLRRIKNAPPGAKQYLSEMVDAIDDAAERGLSKEAAATLRQARTEWRNYKTIEPLLEKSTDGTINPTELLNRVKASPFIKASRSSVGQDQLVDLARIGKEFLPKTGGSDTFPKTVLGGGAGALGITALSNPILATGLAAKGGIALGANRAFQRGYNSSQKLVDKAIGRNPQAQELLKKYGQSELGKLLAQNPGMTLNQAAGIPSQAQTVRGLLPAAAGAMAGVSANAEEPQDQIIEKYTPLSYSEQIPASSFDDAVNTVLEIEGGYVANDAGKGPTNMGINKTANPDIDVENLTQADAKQIYKKRYWDAIGGDRLAPELALVAFDAAVNHGPEKAKQLLKKSGGDAFKLLQLREREYANLIRMNPKKYAQYGESWLSRLQQLAGQINATA